MVDEPDDIPEEDEDDAFDDEDDEVFDDDDDDDAFGDDDEVFDDDDDDDIARVGEGFDADDWTRLAAFNDAVATLDDVQAGLAVFALSDTTRPRLLPMVLPQPVIWWEDDGELAAVAVQAEEHVTAEGVTMQVLGLILPDGASAVALLDDVDLVDDTDPTWVALVDSALD